MSTEKNKITAYDIIALCLGMRLIKENIWKDKSGKTFVLTKFGFEEMTKQQRLRKEEEDKYLSAKLKLMELEEKMNQRSAA